MFGAMAILPGANKPARATGNIRLSTPAVMRFAEGAQYLTCSVRKLRDLVAQRRVRHTKIGNRIVFRKEWLDAFLDGER